MSALPAGVVSTEFVLRNAIRVSKGVAAAVQPRALTAVEQRARATRPDLWPRFIPPPAPPLEDLDDDGLDDEDDVG